MAKFTIGAKETIMQAVRKRSKQIAASITDAQFFASELFLKFANGIVETILRKHRVFSLTITHQEGSDSAIAWTDGKQIYLNTGNTIVSKVDDLYKRFCINMGILFHECAHKLYMDFHSENKAKEQLQKGELYGKEPNYLKPAQMVAVEEIKTALRNPQFNSVICGLYAHLSNVIADGHDEYLMKQEHPGFVAQCIELAGETQYEQAPTLEVSAADLTAPKFQHYFNQFLLYAKLSKFKLGNETPVVKEYMEGLDYMVPYVDLALHTEDYKLRYECLTCILACLWDSIRQLLQKSDNGSGSGSGQSSGGQSGGSDPFAGMTPEEAAKAIADAVRNASGANAPAPQNCKHRSVKIASKRGDDKDKAGSRKDPGSDVFQQMISKLANDMAAAQVQGEMDDALRNHLRSMNLPAIHENVPVRISRHHKCQDPAAYQQILEEVLPLARNMANAMKDLLRELNDEHLQHHRRFGPIIEATEAYRPDGTFFAKKKLPEDLPNMAISVLLDGSGSMSGERLAAGKKALVLLERFADILDIPCMISSHYLSGKKVYLHIYSDFASAMHDEDRKCLGDIKAGGCNHDGIPVRLIGNLLAERPEQTKLFFVISDGTPNGANSYQGEEAIKDVREAVKELHRKNVQVYGAAIGSDAAAIKQMYGEGFLDLTELARFPKTLVKLIRRRIV